MIPFLLPLLFCIAVLNPVNVTTRDQAAQRTPESIGREVFEAIKSKDLGRLESMMPTEAVVEKMLAQTGKTSEGTQPTATPAAALAKMKQKVQEELDDILKSAKKHRVKLPLLQYGGILQNDENPESVIKMRAVVMELRWKDKPVDIAYSVMQFEDEWYYMGILISYDVFSQLKG